MSKHAQFVMRMKEVSNETYSKKQLFQIHFKEFRQDIHVQEIPGPRWQESTNSNKIRMVEKL